MAFLLVAVSQGRAQLVNGIKAVVHDAIVTYEDVEELTAQTEDVLRRQYENEPDRLGDRMRDARAENLEKLMANQLILHEFKSAGYNFPESLIEEAVQEEIHNRYGDRVTATRTMEARGITYEKFRERIRERIILTAMRSKNISSEVIVSPHKVEQYYLAHRDDADFKVEDQVRLRMIVLNKSSDTNAPNARKEAEEILGKLNEGASFIDLATIYSQGSQRNLGGDWGWVEKSVLRSELADVAFSLKPGGRSGVIDTPEACYLMLVEDTRSAHAKPLNEVRDQIEKSLLLAEQKRLEKQWIDRLRKKTFVRYF